MSPSSESGAPVPHGSASSHRSGQETVSLQAWTRQMDAYTGPDTLLDFNQVDNVCIDLTEANSSGQAQLMMGRPTRLSTIMREQAGLQRASRAARILRTKIHELSACLLYTSDAADE